MPEPNPLTRRERIRDPQAAVRISHFERVMEAFNLEMGAKTAISLASFHEQYVAPLERRIAWLEFPWYRKLLIHGRRWWRLFKLRRASPQIPDAMSDPEAKL